MKSFSKYILSLEFDENKSSIHVHYSIGGGLVLKSKLIPYANSHPREIELVAEVFIRSATPEDAF